MQNNTIDKIRHFILCKDQQIRYCIAYLPKLLYNSNTFKQNNETYAKFKPNPTTTV